MRAWPSASLSASASAPTWPRSRSAWSRPAAGPPGRRGAGAQERRSAGAQGRRAQGRRAQGAGRRAQGAEAAWPCCRPSSPKARRLGGRKRPWTQAQRPRGHLWSPLRTKGSCNCSPIRAGACHRRARSRCRLDLDHPGSPITRVDRPYEAPQPQPLHHHGRDTARPRPWTSVRSLQGAISTFFLRRRWGSRRRSVSSEGFVCARSSAPLHQAETHSWSHQAKSAHPRRVRAFLLFLVAQ